MITVSAGLRAEIDKLRGRKLYGRVKIDYSDANIDNTILAWANTILDNTYGNQVYNGKEDVTHKYIALDGQWMLDDTWYLPPVSEVEQSRGEIGWWSQEVCLEDGTFPDAPKAMLGYSVLGYTPLSGGTETYPQLFVNFLPRTISDLRIAFDNARGEYAVDFDIILYALDNSVLHTESITGNAGLKYVTTIADVNLVSQMCLKVYKWSYPGAHAKCAEIFTAISETYEGADIFNIHVIENREIVENGVPLGSTAAGQCTIDLFNRFRAFDFDNTTSKFYNVIRDGVRILPYVGDGVEWVPLGVFFAREWDIPKRGMTVTVTGLDRMALLDESEYKTNQTIQAPADETWTIDTAGEWGGGTLIDCAISGNAIGMVLS